MQSRDIEKNPLVPSITDHIDTCVTVCASILDKTAVEYIPVSIIANTQPDSIDPDSAADLILNETDDEIGRQILMTRPYKGRNDIISALRMLASFKYSVSCTTDKMLDYLMLNITDNKSYADENFIFVSSYINDRMINFHDILEQKGINVIFYIISTNLNTANIPRNVEVYYATGID
jgi:hypothetical protein